MMLEITMTTTMKKRTIITQLDENEMKMKTTQSYNITQFDEK